MDPSQKVAGTMCIAELSEIVTLLDIQPLHHPIRTMLVRVALEFADRIRSIINQDVTAWMEIWKSIQLDSNNMWAFNKAAVLVDEIIFVIKSFDRRT